MIQKVCLLSGTLVVRHLPSSLYTQWDTVAVGALWTVIPAEDGARGGTEDGGMISQKLRVGSLSV